MRDENLALVKRGYEAFGRGDLDFIREMVPAEGVWRTPGYGVFKPEYKGPDGVVEYLTSLYQMTEGTFRSESEAMFADDERVVSLDHVIGTRKGVTLDTHMVHIFLVRDGSVVEVTGFAAEPKRNEEFWS